MKNVLKPNQQSNTHNCNIPKVKSYLILRAPMKNSNEFYLPLDPIGRFKLCQLNIQITNVNKSYLVKWCSPCQLETWISWLVTPIPSIFDMIDDTHSRTSVNVKCPVKRRRDGFRSGSKNVNKNLSKMRNTSLFTAAAESQEGKASRNSKS
jgi:hypothetical protein